ANWIGKNIFGRDKKGQNAWLFADDGSGNSRKKSQKKANKTDIDADKITAREATKAYQDYIASYNKLTDLMSRGKGDTPEARQAYSEYKTAKELYESIAQSVKK
ncbi:MAG: hypothetical protein QGH40_11470, partial [bacterium]|nr:hypothetical protein [bacterium]